MTARLVALGLIDVAVWCLCGIAAIDPVWALAAHALLTAAGYAAWLRATGPHDVAPATFGLFGPLAILAAVSLPRPAPGARADDADDAVFGPRPTRSTRHGHAVAAARLLDGRVHHARPETLGSLVAILRHGDVAARRRALETVVRSFEPGLSPLIALALTDRDQTIRALAAAASARVAQNLLLARATLAGRIEAADDPQATATLATLLADHARADVLLSDSQRGHLREDAVALLPADDPARIRLTLETLWAAGDYAAIDALTASGTPGGEDEPMASWWQAASAA